MCKILFITNMYPSKETPYFGIFVKKILEFLQDQEGVLLKTVIASNADNKLEKYLRYFYSILKTINLNVWDLIYIHYFTHSFLPVLISKFKSKNPKILVHIHGGDLIAENLKSKILIKFSMLFKNKVDFFIVPSKYFANTLIYKYKISNNKIFIYPSGGVDTDIFKPLDKKMCRSLLKIKEDEFVLGYISRIEKNKGCLDFIEALKFLKNDGLKFKAIVVGGGKEEKNFLQKIRSLNLNNKVIFLGKKQYNELPYIYNAMDVFVFPTRLEESLGLVGLEAMACGIPVIGSKIGGLQDYIKDGYNGFFFEPGNSLCIYKKIREFYGLSSEEKLKLSKNALLTAKEYASEKVNKEFLRFLKEACKNADNRNS